MPWYFIPKRQLETSNSNILPPSVLIFQSMIHICFQEKFCYVIVLLKHIIAKKETPRQDNSLKSFLLWCKKQVVHVSFFLHKGFSYLAAITDIPSGRHHLSHSGRSHSSPSLSLLKTAEQNQQGSCNLEHHPDISTLSLSLYMDFRVLEVHSSYSHKPAGKKAL